MRHPAGLPALALLAGAVAGTWLPAIAVPVLAAVLVLVWGVSCWTFARRADVAFVMTIGAGCCLAGAALAAGAEARALAPPLRTEIERHADLLQGKESVSIEGHLREDASPTDHGASLTIDADAIAIDGASRPVRGGVRLAVAGDLVGARIDAWRAGRRVRVWASLREPTVYRNPGDAGADEIRRLARQDLALAGSTKSASLVETIEPGGVVAEAAAASRAAVRRIIARHVGRRSQVAAGIVTAILIGDRAGLTPEVDRRLQEAGTYHVIAISGGNIAILAGLLLAVWRWVAVPSRLAASLTIAGLIAYAVIVGPEPSVQRATFVAVVYLAARLMDHRVPPLNSLAAAAGVLVAISPMIRADAGFVLSFGATAAILIGVPRLSAWLRNHLAASDRTAPRWMSGVAAMGAATCCAEVALMPVAAYWFSRVTFAGFVLNFLAIPLMTLVQLAGMATLALAPLGGGLADRAADVAWLAASGLVESARGVEFAPWLVRRLPAPSLLVLTAYYAGWLAWLACPRRAAIRRAALLATALAAFIVIVAPRGPRDAPPRNWLRVTFLDVAQGDATLVQFPDGRSLLVDTGGTFGGRFDIGGRIIAPALWALGVRRLEYLAISHPDPDHIGGAETVVRDFRPRAIWEGVPVPRDLRIRELMRAAASRAIEWRVLQSGDRLLAGAVEVAVLHPPLPEWERQDVRNDDSLVLDVRYGDVSILLPGDIGRDVEHDLVSTLPPAGLRLLKVSHHGSVASSSAEFIAAARPALAVVSVGRGNPFGHPSPVVLDRYRRAGVEVLRTDLDGAITVETDGQMVEVSTWTGRRLTASGKRPFGRISTANGWPRTGPPRRARSRQP